MEQKVQDNATQLQKPGRKPSEELQEHYERLKENHGIPHFISDVDSRHVPRIVSMFGNEYVKYYGKYVDENAFSEFLEETQKAKESENRNPKEIVRVIDTPDGETLSVGALKIQRNMAELGSEIVHQDYRGASAARKPGNLYNALFQDLMAISKSVMDDVSPETMVETEFDTEGYEGVDILYTQLLADVSAASQHVADENNFAVTGVYDKKFPVAYEGKGRVTVVDMLWADSNIQNEQEKVYVPRNAERIVEEAVENINEKRSESEGSITRSLEHPGNDRHQSFSVKPKVVGDPMNFAEIEVKRSDEGEYSWDDIVKEIDKAERKLSDGEDDYWIGVSLDANNPYCVDAALALEELGFEYAGFNPGKIDAETNRDALEMQYRSGESYDKHFVEESADFIQAMGIEDEVKPDGGHDNETVVRL